MRLVAMAVAVFSAAVISLSGGPAVSAAQQQPKKDKNDPTIVVVESGDNLSNIADAHKTTFQRIFYANEAIENPHLIFPGDELRIPGADEKLKERPIPGGVPVNAPDTTAASAPVEVPAPVEAQSVFRSAPASPAPAVANGSVWDQLAACESGGDWSINTGNGFYGGLQFTLSSWQAAGGSGYPHEASREEQIARAETLLDMQGWGAWPACTSMLGLR